MLGKVRETLWKMTHRRTAREDRAVYDTDDVVQEALIQVWQQQEQQSSLDEFKQTWLWRVARGHSAKLHRFYQAARRSPPGQHPLQEADALATETPDAIATGKEEMIRLLTALDRLPPLEKAVICEHFLEGKSLAMVAREFDKSIDVIRGARARALRSLQSDLK